MSLVILESISPLKSAVPRPAKNVRDQTSHYPHPSDTRAGGHTLERAVDASPLVNQLVYRVDTQTDIHGAMVVAEKRDKTLCVLVTGASRGIGLELVKQYLTRVGRGNYGRGGHVIATCRDPENSLDLLRCFQVDYVSYEVVGLDVANGQSFLDLHEHLRDLDGIEQKIDIVFNNAGVALGRDCAVGTIDYEAWHTSLNTNVMGSMRVLETVLP